MDPVGALLVTGFCWLSGGFLIWVAVQRLRSWRRIARAGIPAEGTVTAVEEDDEGDPWAVIEYRVGTATHQLRVYRQPGRPGDTIPLLVDPAAHDQALVRGSKTNLGSALAFVLGLGVLVFLGGTVPILLLAVR